MLVGYMRVSSNGDRQTTALQRDVLFAAGIDATRLSAFVPGRSRLLILSVSAATPREQVLTPPAGIREHAINGIIACTSDKHQWF